MNPWTRPRCAIKEDEMEKTSPSDKRHPRDLPDGFKDEMMRGDAHLAKTAEREKTIAPRKNPPRSPVPSVDSDEMKSNLADVTWPCSPTL